MVRRHRMALPALSLAFVVGVVGVALAQGLPPGGTFVDDDGSVHEGDIEAIAATGITKGCNPPANDKFCPDTSVTRGAMAAFLVRGLNLSDDGGGNLFVDDDDSIFEGDINKLATAGITKGCNPPANDKFCPSKPVSRAEMASFLTRALGLDSVAPPTTTMPPDDPGGVECDVVVPVSVDEIDGNGAFSGVGPGDVVCLEAGVRDVIELTNLHGSAGNVITVVNSGGVVTIDGSGEYAGIEIENSDYLHVTGTGESSQCGAGLATGSQGCGIRVLNADSAVIAKVKSEHLEIDHIEMGNIGGPGVTIKDNNLGRDEWVLQDVSLHHNYLHDIGTEGVYIGSSYYSTGEPHLVESVHLSYNLVLNTGRDGLQVGSTVDDCSIHHNDVRYSGENDESEHRAGIMNNRGSVCDIYNNRIFETAGWGIYVQGNGTNKIFNNVIIRPGQKVDTGDSGGNGIAVHVGSNIDQSIYVWNNTVVSASGDGIDFGNDVGSDNQVINNIVVDAGGDLIDVDADVTVANNLTAASVTAVGFVDPQADNYTLTNASPAVDTGADLSSNGVTFDHANTQRPQGNAFDIGAYELD